MGVYTEKLGVSQVVEGLYKPAIGERGWGNEVNNNFDKIQSFSTRIDNLQGTLVSNTIPEENSFLVAKLENQNIVWKPLTDNLIGKFDEIVLNNDKKLFFNTDKTKFLTYDQPTNNFYLNDTLNVDGDIKLTNNLILNSDKYLKLSSDNNKWLRYNSVMDWIEFNVKAYLPKLNLADDKYLIWDNNDNCFKFNDILNSYNFWLKDDRYLYFNDEKSIYMRFNTTWNKIEINNDIFLNNCELHIPANKRILLNSDGNSGSEYIKWDTTNNWIEISSMIKASGIKLVGTTTTMYLTTTASGNDVYIRRTGSSGNGVLTFVAPKVRVGNPSTDPGYLFHIAGALGFAPGSSVTPTNNGDVVFELTNNTTLTIKAKGSDGIVRSGIILLS